MRGPAIEPSFVTWPTMRTAMPRSFATRMRADATSRTWVTPPAAPSTADDETVWTESRTSSSGRTSSTWPSTADRSVSAARNSFGASALIRSARNRIWAADSSPDTYRLRPPARARSAATSRSRVDLPTPGSPATRTTPPRTRPPPSTRSSSLMHVESARAASTSIWSIGRAGVAHRSGGGDGRARCAHLLDRSPGLALATASDPFGGLPTTFAAPVTRAGRFRGLGPTHLPHAAQR